MAEEIENPAHAAQDQTVRATLMAALSLSSRSLALAHPEGATRERNAQTSQRMHAQYDAQRRLAMVEVSAAGQRWVNVAEPDQVAVVGRPHEHGPSSSPTSSDPPTGSATSSNTPTTSTSPLPATSVARTVCARQHSTNVDARSRTVRALSPAS